MYRWCIGSRALVRGEEGKRKLSYFTYFFKIMRIKAGDTFGLVYIVFCLYSHNNNNNDNGDDDKNDNVRISDLDQQLH